MRTFATQANPQAFPDYAFGTYGSTPCETKETNMNKYFTAGSGRLFQGSRPLWIQANPCNTSKSVPDALPTPPPKKNKTKHTHTHMYH